MTTSVTQDGGITVGTMADVMGQLDNHAQEEQKIWVAIPRRPEPEPKEFIAYNARTSIYEDLIEMLDSRLGALQSGTPGYTPKNPTETLVEFRDRLREMIDTNERSDGGRYFREGWPEDGSPEEFRIGKITYNRGPFAVPQDRVVLEAG